MPQTHFIISDPATLIKYAADHRKDPSIGSFKDYIKRKEGIDPAIEITIDVKSERGDVDLTRADLSKGDFSGVNFDGMTVTFARTNLTDANLCSTTFRYCDFRSSTLENISIDLETDLYNCDLTRPQQENLDSKKRELTAAKEAAAPPEERAAEVAITAQDQRDGAGIIGTALQIGTTAALLATGFGTVAAPLVGTAVGQVVSYGSQAYITATTDSTTGRSETAVAKASAVIGNFVKRQIATRLEGTRFALPKTEKAAAKRRELQTTGLHRGTWYTAAGITAATAVASYAGLPIPSPVVAAVASCALAGAVAINTTGDATADALSTTTVGDRLTIRGAKVESAEEILRQAGRQSVAAQVALSVPGVTGIATALIAASAASSIGKSNQLIEDLTQKGVAPEEALETAIKTSFNTKLHTSLKYAAIAAVVIAVVLITVSTFGVAGGVLAAGTISPLVISFASFAGAFITGAARYYMSSKSHTIPTEPEKPAPSIAPTEHVKAHEVHHAKAPQHAATLEGHEHVAAGLREKGVRHAEPESRLPEPGDLRTTARQHATSLAKHATAHGHATHAKRSHVPHATRATGAAGREAD